MAIAQRLLRDVHVMDDTPQSSLLLDPRRGALDPALPRPRQFCGGA
jgi:hypothetical protein